MVILTDETGYHSAPVVAAGGTNEPGAPVLIPFDATAQTGRAAAPEAPWTTAGPPTGFVSDDEGAAWRAD